MDKKQGRQKLFKEREIFEFVDLANEHGFDVSQTIDNHATNLITVRDDKSGLGILEIKLTKFMSNEIPEEPFSLYRMENFKNETDFDKLAWLLKQSNQLINRLRYNTKDVKPVVEDKNGRNDKD